MTVVDMHSHFVPESWPDLAERFGTANWPWMKHTGPGKAMIMVGEREFRPIYDACWSAERRLEEMDRDGVDIKVMCATPILFGYLRAAGEAYDCAQIFNDAALDICAHDTKRLTALCQVTLQRSEEQTSEIE